MKSLKKYIALFFFLCVISSAFSCKKQDDPVNNQDETELNVALDNTALTLIIGEAKVIKADFETGITPKGQYNWVSVDPAVATVTSNPDFTATITAKAKGSTQIRFVTAEGVVKALCLVNVEEEVVDDGILRILAIGNSFSDDAFEHNFPDLARADGQKLIIGHLLIGGSSLEQHVQNANNNTVAYFYNKINVEGVKTSAGGYTLLRGITDEKWDYISVQQVSGKSGLYNTFETDLPPLMAYIKSKVTNPNVKYILHQTWAYEATSTHADFANYNRDQMTMYNAIIDAVGRAKTLMNADVVVPAGTAIQNARTSYIGDNFTRDGYHLDLTIGRYTAACAWFETIFGKSVIGNPYKPAGLSDYKAALAQTAAHLAVLKPNEITELTDFKDPEPAGPLTKALYLAFGTASSTPTGWNRLSSSAEGATLINMKDTDATETSVGLTLTEGFYGYNVEGAVNTTTDFNMPSSVSQVNLFGNTKVFGSKIVAQSKIKLSGLDKTKKYNICYFGSRMNVTDNRETAYIANGTNEVKVYLNVSGNNSNTVCAADVQPNNNGEITITITAGPNNNNANGFFHINAMRITPVL